MCCKNFTIASAIAKADTCQHLQLPEIGQAFTLRAAVRLDTKRSDGYFQVTPQAMY